MRANAPRHEAMVRAHPERGVWIRNRFRIQTWSPGKFLVLVNPQEHARADVNQVVGESIVESVPVEPLPPAGARVARFSPSQTAAPSRRSLISTERGASISMTF